MILQTKHYSHSFLNKKSLPDAALLEGKLHIGSTDMVCIAGRPGTGKTALALQCALEYAKSTGNAVYFFSLYHGAKQIYERLVCSVAEIDRCSLQSGTITEEEKDRLLAAAENLKALDIIFDDEVSEGGLEMLKRLDRASNVGLIIIDTVQMISTSSSKKIRRGELNYLLEKLKAHQKRKGAPVIFTYDLKRSIDKRKNKKPVISDLKKDGTRTYELSDTVILTSLSDCSYANSSQPGKVGITIAESAFGEPITLSADLSCDHFSV